MSKESILQIDKLFQLRELQTECSFYCQLNQKNRENLKVGLQFNYYLTSSCHLKAFLLIQVLKYDFKTADQMKNVKITLFHNRFVFTYVIIN